MSFWQVVGAVIVGVLSAQVIGFLIASFVSGAVTAFRMWRDGWRPARRGKGWFLD